MKRIVIAGVGCMLTCGLAIFAVALAQRDSRDRESVLDTVDPDYANQKPEPIAFSLPPDANSSDHSTSALKTIVEPIMQPMPGDESIAPLNSTSSSETWSNEDLVNSTPIDNSETVLAAGQEPLPSKAPTLAPPPGLLATPPTSTVPKLSRATVESGSPIGESAIGPSVNGPPSMLSPVPNTAASQTSPKPNSSPQPPLRESSVNPSTPFMSSPITPSTSPNTMASIPSLAEPSSRAELSSPPPPTYPGPPSIESSKVSPPVHNLAPAIPSLSAPTPVPSYPSSTPSSVGNSSKAVIPPGNTISTNGRGLQLASPAPGTRQMDGAQNPSLQIQKRAPEEVQVGQPATFALLVRNVGNATAYEVSVADSVPRGTRLSKTSPPAESHPDGTLIWSLGEMKAGSEQVLTVELIPETEGEIGSVASVNFAAQASVRTVSTQPKLTIKQVADSSILLGKTIRIQVTVTNEGTGVARAVSLEEDVPAGLKHPLGGTLGVPLGDLVPGQSRSTELELTATAPGSVRNLMRAVSANTSASESAVDIEVVAPLLKVSSTGPSLRYLERQATYQISVTNQGTSAAYNVEIIANLPRGLQYNSSGNHGEYHSGQHAVSWGLEELAVGATATTDLTLLPVEEGEFAIRLQSQAIGVQSEPMEKQVRVEGQSELAFSIDDDHDPIEVDGQTTYSVTLTNSGTRVDENVQVMIEVPKGARVLQVNGPVGFNETPQGLLFDPISQMRAKDRQIFRFSVQHTQEGVHVVRAHVKSKLRPIAVVNEESTEVYRDQ